MGSRSFSARIVLTVLVVLVLHAARVAAFGAGNIASISAVEGQNWRHGDIEDTLLHLFLARVAGGRRFSKMDVKRVYFGNWLRDYSQAVDVGSVKYVSAEAVRLIVWVLGFMSFGYGSGAFEVTRERLGCYRPEEHIDNPKDYADNVDARRYDSRLRGPVDGRRELGIDTRTGLKHYIATEDVSIMTSARLVRDLYGRCIQMGRRYGRTRNEQDLFEAFRLLGTADHCLEDYAAHSNYVELALREMGERDVFPFVGRRSEITLPGARSPVYPVVTGTFGGVDFLYSVLGEFEDRATQSEVQQLEGSVQSSQGSSNLSLLQDLLSKIPASVFGGKDHAAKASHLQMNAQAAQMQNMNISPRQPEEWERWLDQASRQIYPVLGWHDEIMLDLNEMIEKIPLLPQLIDQLTNEINIFVFSLLGPFVLPILQQVKTELAAGSSEIIQSSRERQLNVFRDDYCTDPTHSMLSKDHFSNFLNEPAGKVSAQVLRWVIPQIMACWDDERIDANRTLDRIVHGVFHHPALRDFGGDGAVDGRRGMFMVVEEWWGAKSKSERELLRSRLCREGVENGRNHKDGVQDSGHGCGQPLGMPTMQTASSSGAVGGLAAGSAGGTKVREERFGPRGEFEKDERRFIGDQQTYQQTQISESDYRSGYTRGYGDEVVTETDTFEQGRFGGGCRDEETTYERANYERAGGGYVRDETVFYERGNDRQEPSFEETTTTYEQEDYGRGDGYMREEETTMYAGNRFGGGGYERAEVYEERDNGGGASPECVNGCATIPY